MTAPRTELWTLAQVLASDVRIVSVRHIKRHEYAEATRDDGARAVLMYRHGRWEWIDDPSCRWIVQPQTKG